ncbi:MAG: fructose-6-phosphate aldolase [Ardenticatenales bacterium]|nr:fructose-6-phosphate aldolase [Ardenticatenales bacterium]
MKIFLDTAILDEIKAADAWGVLDGVTTNPSLAAQAGRNFKENILAISALIGERAGTVSAETVSLETDGMIEEARLVTSWADNIVAKIPLTPNGLAAVSQLAKEGIRTNVTLVFSANQGLLAMKAGATYISPFVGRIDDTGHDGMQLVRDLVEIKNYYGYESEILAASLRHPLHVTDAALAGADIATLPFGVMKKMFGHPLTDSGLQRFLDDWATIDGSMRPF